VTWSAGTRKEQHSTTERNAIMRELRRFDGEPELSHIYRMLVLAHEQTHAERALLIQLVAEAAERERAG
jgi:hypothetical protein